VHSSRRPGVHHEAAVPGCQSAVSRRFAPASARPLPDCRRLVVQAWLALNNLVVEPRCRAKYHYDDFRRETVLKVRPPQRLHKLADARADRQAASPSVIGCFCFSLRDRLAMSPAHTARLAYPVGMEDLTQSCQSADLPHAPLSLVE
jgi:hypothetical protein